MANFVSNNLVGTITNSDEALKEHFIKLAEKSFEQEKSFYKKLGIDKMSGIPTNVVQAVEIFTNNTQFDIYQSILEDSLYGKNTHFIKYFYDKDFIGYLSGKAVSVESVLKNLEQDLAQHALALSDKIGEGDEEAEIIDGDLELEQQVEIIYEINKVQSSIILQMQDIKNHFKGKTAIKNAELQKYIAEAIIKKEGKKVRVVLNKSKQKISLLLTQLNKALSDAQGILGTVTKRNKGYYITRGFEFGKDDKNGNLSSLGQVLFGQYGRPNPINEKDSLIKDGAAITYSGLLKDSTKSVAGDIINALNVILTEKNIIPNIIEEEVSPTVEADINEIMGSLVDSLVEGMQHGKANVAGKSKDGKRKGNKRIMKEGKTEMFEVNFSSPDMQQIFSDGEYSVELRGGADMFATLFSDNFKTEFQKLLTNNEDVSEKSGSIICSIPIIREDKNLFFNQLNNSVSPDNYSKEGLKHTQQRKDFDKQLEMDARMVAKSFSEVIASVIATMEGAEDIQGWKDSTNFKIWWGSEGEAGMTDALMALIKKNPTQIYEILTKKDPKQVAGMIGETVFGAIIMKKMLSSNDSIVQMLGQTSHGNGEAAVDLKMLNVDILEQARGAGPLITNGSLNEKALEQQRLSSVGFQLKNYTASAEKDREVLYRTDNKLLSDTSTMKRYLQSSFLSEIQNWLNKENKVFFQHKDQTNLTGEQKSTLITIGNILTYHLPYFMRFDEAQMSDENFGIEQNNFYIVNFKFIPSSVLFYMMGQVIDNQSSKIADTQTSSLYDQYFYFSSYETGSEKKERHSKGETKTPHKNFLESYWQFREDDFSKSSYNNLVAWHYERLALNFAGVKVSFGRAFDSIVEKASK